MVFSQFEAEKLKKECVKALNKHRHKSTKLGLRRRKRNKFSKIDESKYKVVKGQSSAYWDYVEKQGKGHEELAADPDLWEETK